MTFFYFDTNVLRYFGQAFHSTQLESTLRSRIALSPLSVAEILVQVRAKEAYDAIRAIWNWLEPTNAQFLDWPEMFIREHVFGIQTPRGAAPPHVFQKLNESLHSNAGLPSFQETAEGITRCWEYVERRSAELRRSNIALLRSQHVEDPTEIMRKFSLKSLRSIAGVQDSSTVADNEILDKLRAYIELDIAIVSIALNEPKFNFLSKQRMNDQLDMEQLVYLADDRAKYLTSDKKAYKRVKATPQGHRIWIEDPLRLKDPEKATEILRQMSE